MKNFSKSPQNTLDINRAIGEILLSVKKETVEVGIGNPRNGELIDTVITQIVIMPGILHNSVFMSYCHPTQLTEIRSDDMNHYLVTV